MNLFQQEDALKGMPDQRLADEMRTPSGMVPQYMVMAELNRRKKMREEVGSSPDNGASVKDEMMGAMDQFEPAQQDTYQDGGLVLPPEQSGASMWDSLRSMFGYADTVEDNTAERSHMGDLYGVPERTPEDISQEAFDILKETGNAYQEGGPVAPDYSMWDSLRAMFGYADTIPETSEEREWMIDMFEPRVPETNDEAFRRLQMEQGSPIGYKEGGRIREVGKTAYADGGSVFDRPSWQQYQRMTGPEWPYETRSAARREMGRLMRDNPPMSTAPALPPPVVEPMRPGSSFDRAAQTFTDSLNAEYMGGAGRSYAPSDVEPPSVEIPRGTQPIYTPSGPELRSFQGTDRLSTSGGPFIGVGKPDDVDYPMRPLDIRSMTEESVGGVSLPSVATPPFFPSDVRERPASSMDPFMDAATTDAPDAMGGIGSVIKRGYRAFKEGWDSAPSIYDKERPSSAGEAAARGVEAGIMAGAVKAPVTEAPAASDEAVVRANPTKSAEMVPSGSTVGVAARTDSLDALSDYEKMRRVIGFEPGAQDRLIDQLEAKTNALRGDIEGDYKRDKWMALAQLGATMAAGDSPYFAQNFGEGATAGIAAMREANKSKADRQMAFLGMDADLTQARIAAQKGDVDTAANIYTTAINNAFKREELNLARQANAIRASKGGGSDLKVWNAQYKMLGDAISSIDERLNSGVVPPEEQAELNAKKRAFQAQMDAIAPTVGLPPPYATAEGASSQGGNKNPFR